MEPDYESQGILFPNEGLFNRVICVIGDIEPIEEGSIDVGRMTKDSDHGSLNEVEYSEDTVGISKLGKYFGGCLELECDEIIKPEHVSYNVSVENEANFLKNSEVKNTEYFNGSLKLDSDCDDEIESSQETSVINISPIWGHKLDSDIDESDECQVTSYSGGRLNSNKRIKLELADCDSENISIECGNIKCTIVEKPSPLDSSKSSVVNEHDEKTSDIPNSSGRFSGHCDKVSPNKADFTKVSPDKANFTTVSPNTADFTKVSPKKADFTKVSPNKADFTKVSPNTADFTKVSPNTAEFTKVSPNKADHTTWKKCPVCGFQFSERMRNSMDFADHLKRHFPGLHTCHFCQQGFMKKENRQKHHSFHKRRKFHSCHVCGVHIEPCEDLKVCVNAHMETHKIQQQGIHPVPECLSTYVKINSDNDQPYTCNICGTAFRMLRHLLTHLTGHSITKAKNFCVVCRKECIWKVDINMWMCKSHPDRCNICGVRNLKPEDIDSHRETHYGTFYNCEKCDQGFTRQENLESHMLSSHSSLRPKNTNTCLICQYVTESDVDMKKHTDCHRTMFNNGLPGHFNAQIKMHSGNYVCNLCGVSYSQTQLLISHLLKHIRRTIACEDCGNEYIFRNELKEHAAKGNCSLYKEKPSVSMKSHRSPFAITLHNCQFCEQQFFFVENLVKHNKVIHDGKKVQSCVAGDESLPSEEPQLHVKQSHRDVIFLRNTRGHLMSSNVMTNSSGLGTSYVCNICGTSHCGLFSMRTHLLLHCRTAEFCCNFCGTEFVESEHLSHHNSLFPEHVKLKHTVFEEHPYCKPLDESGSIINNNFDTGEDSKSGSSPKN